MARSTGLGDVTAEYAASSLGDARLDARFARVASRAASAPEQSFPEQMASEGDQEALYRFLGNRKVTMEGMLAPHVRQTHSRMAGCKTVRIVHDTTTFCFEGEREGLGIVARGTKGFHAHVALAIAVNDARDPLGVVGVKPYIHADTQARRTMTLPERIKANRAAPRAERESSRWETAALKVSAELPAGVRAIHVADQEADDFVVFATLQQAGQAYVIRGQAMRVTSIGGAREKRTVRDDLADKTATILRTVSISARNKKRALKGRHPERLERKAALSVKWGTVTLFRPTFSKTPVKQLTMQAVHVFETNAPDGQEPIEWMLFTSEPVETLEQAAEIVDHYRARWMIEEYFKALKTGCAFEQRQLMTYDALVRALALFIPLAWRLLVLRRLGGAPDERPATDVLDAEQLLLLTAMLADRGYKRFPPKDPTVRDAMLAVASLGGHIRNNGDPGWMVLGRGFRKLVEAELVWRRAREK